MPQPAHDDDQPTKPRPQRKRRPTFQFTDGSDQQLLPGGIMAIRRPDWVRGDRNSTTTFIKAVCLVCETTKPAGGWAEVFSDIPLGSEVEPRDALVLMCRSCYQKYLES